MHQPGGTQAWNLCTNTTKKTCASACMAHKRAAACPARASRMQLVLPFSISPTNDLAGWVCTAR